MPEPGMGEASRARLRVRSFGSHTQAHSSASERNCPLARPWPLSGAGLGFQCAQAPPSTL